MHPLKSILPVLGAALTLLSARGLAADLSINVPDTPQARLASDLIGRVTAALVERLGGGLSNVWIFPTGDPHTVFVQYSRAGTSTASATTVPVIHLALVVMNGDHIAQVHEFTDAGSNSPLHARPLHAKN